MQRNKLYVGHELKYETNEVRSNLELIRINSYISWNESYVDVSKESYLFIV